MSTEALTKQAIELLSALIRIPRTSRNEAEASRFLKSFMEQECKLPTQADGCNLWTIAAGYNPSLPTLLLNAHIDVVPAAYESQYEPEIKDGWIYARGASDCLGNAVCIIKVLCKADPDLRKALKAAGFLTRDPRMKERKKYGLKAARRAPQFSKR